MRFRPPRSCLEGSAGASPATVAMNNDDEYRLPDCQMCADYGLMSVLGADLKMEIYPCPCEAGKRIQEYRDKQTAEKQTHRLGQCPKPDTGCSECP